MRAELAAVAAGDLALMRIQVETLFTHDVGGRMVRVNEPSGKAAPRFFIGRTVQGSEWRVRHDLEDDLVTELASACAREPVSTELLSPHDSASFDAIYQTILARYAAVERTEAGPAYHFPADLPATPDVVRVTTDNLDILRPHLEAWLGDVVLGIPLVAALADGRAVSVCGSVRIAPLAHEAGVETAPEFRGRGYARRVVPAWARLVRRKGRIPLYSTSWQNTASQAVARALGLRQFGSDMHIT